MRVTWFLSIVVAVACSRAARPADASPEGPRTAGVIPDLASRPVQPAPTCPAVLPVGAVPFDTARWSSLAGRFELETVVTSIPRMPLARVTLELERADSASRFYHGNRAGNSPRGPRGEILLMGRVRTGRDTALTLDSMAEVERGTLYLGCRACTDASPRHYRVLGVTPDGFWGTWTDYQTGIGVLVDAHGNRLPNPAGYYCARRLPASR